MDGGDPFEARRDQVRRHELRLAILALASQGKAMNPPDLHRELPAHPAVAVIEYHLLVLQRVGLLPSPAAQG
jgi:hypothetical protein